MIFSTKILLRSERYFARMTDEPPSSEAVMSPPGEAVATQPFPETTVVGAQIPSPR